MEEATFRLRGVLPRILWVSSKTVHRAETNPDPDPVLAAGLARVYGKSRQEMPARLVEELDQVLATVTNGQGDYLASAAPDIAA